MSRFVDLGRAHPPSRPPNLLGSALRTGALPSRTPTTATPYEKNEGGG